MAKKNRQRRAKEVLSQKSIEEIDVDTETNEEEIARKIESDIRLSISAYQDLKSKFTEYYFDYLSYKEDVQDKLKSNTFIPLPYVAVVILKAALKRAILATRPYGRVIPSPFNADLSWRLSLLYDELLNDAQYRKFIDIAMQDCLIYGNAIYMVTHELTEKLQPTFKFNVTSEELEPEFDEDGNRVWRPEVIKDGICLTNIHIQNFYLPPKALSAELAKWNSVLHQMTYDEIKDMEDVQNLDRLKELKGTKRQDTNETQRYESATHKASGHPTTEDTYDIYQYVTDKKIFYKPAGANFLITKPRNNPYNCKPFHIAQVMPLNSEPYGLSPTGSGHLMSHTVNEVVDVIMDGLWLEDNKCFVVNQQKVNDFELRARQGNIIHVNMDESDDVRKHVYPIETRAIATEVMQLLEWFHLIHQKASGGISSGAGIPIPGAETAYENAALMQGALARVPDYLDNLEESLGQTLFNDIAHILKIYSNQTRKIPVYGDNNETVKEIDVIPSEVYSHYKFQLEWVGRERQRIEERAQLVQLLQVVGNMTNINEITQPIIENLLILSGIRDKERIDNAIKAVIERNKMIQLMEARQKSGEGGEGSPESMIGGESNLEKMIGDSMGQSVNSMSPETAGEGM